LGGITGGIVDSKVRNPRESTHHGADVEFHFIVIRGVPEVILTERIDLQLPGLKGGHATKRTGLGSVRKPPQGKGVTRHKKTRKGKKGICQT